MPSPISFDLDAYLQRINLHARVAPDLATLQAIVHAHTATIPFENIDPFRGVVPDLDLDAIQHKLVHAGRGGYCFEQNGLLSAALQSIGFDVTNLGARVMTGQSADAIPARTHMILKVMLDGEPWLADVGYGGATPTAPLRLIADEIQRTPHEPFRLSRDGSDWELAVQTAGEWKLMYRCDLQPQYPVDYLVSNYWVAARAESKFVTDLFAARAASGRRLSLRNRVFTERAIGGDATQRTLASAAEVRTILRDQFLIHLPDDPALDGRLGHLAA